MWELSPLLSPLLSHLVGEEQERFRMQLVVRQTPDGSGGGTSSTLSTATDLPSSSSSSDDPTSQPTSFPPTSLDPTLPTSDPTILPSVSDLTSLPHSSSSSTIPPPLHTTISSPASIDPLFSPTTTENMTTIVTTLDGQATTFTSHLPTSLADLPPTASATNRTAVIAGTTTAVAVFLLLILAAVFAYRKRRLRKNLSAYGQKKEGRGLLDGEDFNDEVLPQRMVSYRDLGPSTPIPRSTSPSPSLLKSRTSETGSVFREEVWPPPGFIDPISNRSNQVDLSKIVDEVMGPSDSNSPSTSRSGLHAQGMGSYSSSSCSGVHEREFTDATIRSDHSYFSLASANSNSPLLAPRNDRPHIPPISQYVDPLGGPPRISSISSPPLPPGASPPTTPGAIRPQIPPSSHYPMHSTSSYPGMSPSPGQNVFPQVRSKPTTQPKKSSPLARALTGDAKIWLGRSAQGDGGPAVSPP